MRKTMQRHRVELTTTDTGRTSVNLKDIRGVLNQILWQPKIAGSSDAGYTDTGGLLEVIMHPSAKDTGTGKPILTTVSGLAASFFKSPVQETHGLTGLDTGTDQQVPYILVGDSLTIKARQGDTGHLEGTAYIYIG